MKRIYTLVLLVFISSISFAQSFEIGETTITFNDPARSGGFGNGGGPGRQIQTEIYYPADVSGTNVAVANGEFPVIVFGHGFAMAWSAYENIWEDLVAKGYILAFPRTEGSLLPAPSHNDFGLDLALVETQMQAFQTDANSLFFQKIIPASCIMGHSMGGGATFIAAGNNTSPTLKAVIGLAPAETDPSAVAAAANVSVDVLILSGSSDGVTPPADHHDLIYDAINNDCKFFFSLIGAGHCRFANNNTQCNLGELFSGAGSLSRARVHELTSTIISPWLDFKLKGNCTSWEDFQDVIATEPDLSITDDCGHEVIPTVSITPTGQVNACASGSVSLIYSPNNPNFSYEWFKDNTTTGQSNSPYAVSTSGDYYVEATSAFNCSTISNTTEIIFGNTASGVINETRCAGSSYTYNALVITNDTLFFDTLTNGSSLGCDSVTEVNISFRAQDNTSFQTSFCNGENFELPNGLFVDEAGTYPFTYTNQFNCDSTHTIFLEADTAIQLFSVTEVGTGGDTIGLYFDTNISVDSFFFNTTTADFLSTSNDTSYFSVTTTNDVDFSGTLFANSCSFDFNYTYSITSLKNRINDNPLVIYPNPVNDVLSIKVAINEYQIIDILGRLVESNRLNQNFTTISTATLPSGTYFLRTNEGNALFVKE